MVVNGQFTNTSRDLFQQHLYERYRLLTVRKSELQHASFSPITQKQAFELISSSDSSSRNRTDDFNLSFIKKQLWFHDSTAVSDQPAFLGIFYKNRLDGYSVNQPAFKLKVNPVLYLSGGKQQGETDPLFINTRGIEVQGLIDKKVGFYSYIGENQARFPTYVRQYRDSVKALPGEGFHKIFKENGYDYFHVNGYVDFNATKHINVQFGYDQFKIGTGIRSVLLSDQSSPYTFLKLQTRVWKINYTNLFAQLTQNNRINNGILTGTGGYPQKFMSLHHLSVNLGKKVNIGLFESVMYGTADSLSAIFEAKYLNPIIFYRAIEHQTGSAGNVQVGADFEILPTKGIAIYGQFLLDEFVLQNVKEQNGWWGNKYAGLIGIKYMNAFTIPNLDLNLEGSQARPYTYSHYTDFGSYSHYRQPLAHPLGANFKEFIADVRYQPIPKLVLSLRWMAAKRGMDEKNKNWGSDILKDYTTREQEFNNTIGQGITTSSNYLAFSTTYILFPGLYIDARFTNRSSNNELGNTTSDVFFEGGIRLNIKEKRHEF